MKTIFMAIGLVLTLTACGGENPALKEAVGASDDSVVCDYDPLQNIKSIASDNSEALLRRGIILSQAAKEVTTYRDRIGVDVIKAGNIQSDCMRVVYEAMTPLYETMASNDAPSDPNRAAIINNFGNVYGSLGRVIELGGSNADVVSIKSNAESAHIYGKKAALIE